MFDCSFGPVLLAVPAPLALDWALVSVALLAGYLWPTPGPLARLLYQPLCFGAAVLAISRDFGIPFDAALVACLPVSLARWGGQGPLLRRTLVAAIVVNYFVLAPDLGAVPAHPWAPALAAFVFVARAPPTALERLARVGLVVARYRVPRAVHALYGALLFVLEPLAVPGYDRTMGPALAYTLSALVALEPWYGYLCAAGASTLLLPRKFTI